jgi:type IV secretory pathway VirB2 component (pilin)
MTFKIELGQDFYWRLFILLCVAAIVLVASESAFAAANPGAAAQGNDIIGTTLCRLTQNLTGGIARAIATIAIFAVGVSLFMGKLNWGTAAMTAAGVGIVFGSAQMVAWLSGSAGNSACSGA